MVKPEFSKLDMDGFNSPYSLHSVILINMSKIAIKCNFCNIEFLKRESEIKRTKNNFCSNKCCLNFNSKVSALNYKNIRIVEYSKNPKKCLHCDLNLEYSKRFNKFCSAKCSAIENQKFGGHRKWTEEEKKKMSEWAKKHAFVPNPKNRILKECKNCKKVFEVTPCLKNRLCCSNECKNQYIKISGFMKGRSGGYREKGGRGKQGWYKGYYCNSSWELAWVIYNLDHNIKFKRNTEGFSYIFNEQAYKFFPDFIIESTNEYVEIKGYLDAKNKAKIISFPHPLKVIDKYNIKIYLNYAIEKYGKNFISLYENNQIY